MNHPLSAHTAAGPVLSNGNPGSRRRFLKTGTAAVAGVLAGCGKPADPPVVIVPPPAPPVPPPKLWNLSELAPPPDWSRLDVWQETISAADFRHLLENVLTDGNAFWSTVEQREDRAIIRTSTALEGAPRMELKFAAESVAKPDARYWRKFSEMGRPASGDRPLDGVRIALDPGHIGGAWAKMEGRWYHMSAAAQPVLASTPPPAPETTTAAPETKPVMEGELTLQTAHLLRPLLEAMGATVTLVRDSLEPLTSQQPDALLVEARESLLISKGPGAELTEVQIRREAERLFYRTSEIRTRGHRVNEVLKPDLLVCLHYNAESWGGDAAQPVFSSNNHVHVLAHGCLSQAEFSLDDQRLDSLLRLLQRIPEEEIRLCDAVARHLATATGLSAYIYRGKSARRVNDNPFLWARNLLANRVYHCPVVFTEPYVMNNQEVFDRIQAGDYEGEKEIAGKARRSIFREYAQAVADGLADAARAGRVG